MLVDLKKGIASGLRVAAGFVCIGVLLLSRMAVSDANDSEGRWDGDKAKKWYSERGWIAGCNYVPSTACNTTEFWGAETFDPGTISRELSLAGSIGFGSCRVFLQ